MEAIVGDAHALPFDATSFDGAWADRTFQHLVDPVTALGEMVRLTAPGGRVVVVDPDYGTQVVSVPDQQLARRVLDFRADRVIRNGRLAQQMPPRLFAHAGLDDVQVEAVPIVVRDPTALDNGLGLRDWAGFAHQHGLIVADEVRAWTAALDEAAATDCFRYAFSLFITVGRKSPRAP